MLITMGKNELHNDLLVFIRFVFHFVDFSWFSFHTSFHCESAIIVCGVLLLVNAESAPIELKIKHAKQMISRKQM